MTVVRDWPLRRIGRPAEPWHPGDGALLGSAQSVWHRFQLSVEAGSGVRQPRCAERRSEWRILKE
jgi:hypothetical protein